MSRLCRVALITVLALGVTAAPAVSAPDHKLGAILGQAWQTVLETPPADNPFTGGDPCVQLDKNLVAPFAPLGTTELSCTVKPGTRIFVAAESSECSNVELPPFFGEDEVQLRECARDADAGFDVPVVTVDGRQVTVREVESGLLQLDLPAENILGAPEGPALSVAHGWAALVGPLTPGTHEITIQVVGTDVFGNAVDFTNTTTIIVSPGR